MLSRFGKHAQALEEACAAVLEMDRLWTDLTKANGVAAAAVRDHRSVTDALKNSKVSPGLQELIMRPPKWLEQAVVVSVEAKHCVALELEYCLAEQGPMDVSMAELQRTPGKRSRPGSAGVQVGPGCGTFLETICTDEEVSWAVQAGSSGVQHLKNPWALIERLHSEGLALAELLLPHGHPLLDKVRRTERQARSRNPTLAALLEKEAQEAAERAAEDAR